MKTRDEIQQEAISLIENNNTVILELATGIGKSACAIKAINNLQGITPIPLRVLLLVAEVAHINNWKAEFAKWELTDKIDITIECYASLKKYRNTTWDIAIFDEIHHINSELRIDLFKSLKINKLIGLSATVTAEVYNGIKYIRKDYKTLKVTLKDAIEWGVLPKPKLYLIPLVLDNYRKTESILEEWGSKHKRIVINTTLQDRWKYIKDKTKYPNITLHIECTQKEKYDHITQQFEYWKKRYMQMNQDFAKNKWLLLGSERKRFLGECKTKYLQRLLNTLEGKRFICFCSSIKQAEKLHATNCIHSKKKDVTKIIESFNNKEIDNIFAIGMLQEGQNLIDIDAGIIAQLDGVERAFTQKFGRTLRAEDPEQYVFYYKDTRDEGFLQKILNTINEEYVQTLNINEI